MKLPLTLILAMLCFEGVTSFYHDANVALPQVKDLSSAINKCSTTAEKIDPTLCKIVKKTLQVDTEEYKKASEAVTNVQFLFGDIMNFYDSFLKCLNEQTGATTADEGARILGNLAFRIDVHILTGLDRLTEAGDALGAVFGESVKTVVTNISESYKSEFTTVKVSIESIATELLKLNGSAVTSESLKTDINVTVLSDMITAFKDIYVTSEQVNTIMIGIEKVSTTLEVTTTAAEKVETKSMEAVTKATYQLDVSIQGSKKVFTEAMTKYETTLTTTFSQFDSIASSQFIGDKDIQESRSKVEDFMTSIKGMFQSTSEMVINTFTESLTQATTIVSEMQTSIAACTDKVTNYLAETVSKNSASFTKCMGPNTNFSIDAVKIISNMGTQSSTCITTQKTTTLMAQSYMKFVVEDVLLNLKGVADKLCGCSVNKSKKEIEISKECINKYVDEMESTIKGEEISYVEGELTVMQSNVTMSTETFKMCSTNVTMMFDVEFAKLQTGVDACMAI